MTPTEAKIMDLLEGEAASCCMDNEEDRRRVCGLLLVHQPWIHDTNTTYAAIKNSLTAVVKANLSAGKIDVETASAIMALADEMARNAAQIVIGL